MQKVFHTSRNVFFVIIIISLLTSLSKNNIFFQRFSLKFIVGRGVLIPLFYKDPPYCLPSPFSNLVQHPFLVPSNPQAHCSFCCLVSSSELRHIWCGILLNDTMDLLMSSLRNFVSEGSWSGFYPSTFLHPVNGNKNSLSCIEFFN